MCNCSRDNAGARCHNEIEVCSPNPCPGGFDCKVTDGSIHCDPLPQVGRNNTELVVFVMTVSSIKLNQSVVSSVQKLNPMIGYMEILEISGSVLGLLFLVSVFVCVRKRYVQQKKKKPVCVQDSNGYFHTSLAKSLKADKREVSPIEMSSLVGPVNDLDHTPFRSLRPHSQIGLSGGGDGVSLLKTQGPVVCSVAPNLPARPPSSSDNDSIRKNHWDMDYEVYPADPDYYGRPAVQEFPQFDIVEDTYASSAVDPRRNSRFGGFPFPLDRCDRRAPLPPCYSNQNLDDFLGPDGLPLASSQCPNEYTAISYYPAQNTRSHDNVSGGYKRLSMRLSVAMPSYAEQAGPPPPPPPPNPAEPQTRPAGENPRSYDGSSMVGSDYGSCEEFSLKRVNNSNNDNYNSLPNSLLNMKNSRRILCGTRQIASDHDDTETRWIDPRLPTQTENLLVTLLNAGDEVTRRPGTRRHVFCSDLKRVMFTRDSTTTRRRNPPQIARRQTTTGDYRSKLVDRSRRTCSRTQNRRPAAERRELVLFRLF
ncbi:hypothetical protein F2P81_008442 [Scophthalmus maximus]|uniref:Uncharacterized protein n=1 Tax=Scophthalmus maximus TaxID=52904 RepID=A0A6A4T2A8_SCOMX|nr:hypothetical protein F2P81_008442 [Scophthalmus maximus]